MKNAVSRIGSLAINLFLFFTSLCFMVIPIGLTDYWERYPIYISEFIMCMSFIVIALAIPFGANFLLYRFWYKKSGMSKLWVAIPLLTVYLILGLLLVVFIFSIPEWGRFTWQIQ
ncbi:MAG: hypothetical protein K2H90_05400 [Oscillospiraceae bacterium]|nr:hypothetical protein [Oscillospiraceae bacterium]